MSLLVTTASAGGVLVSLAGLWGTSTAADSYNGLYVAMEKPSCLPKLQTRRLKYSYTIVAHAVTHVTMRLLPVRVGCSACASGVNKAIVMATVYYFVLRDPHNVVFGEFALVSHATAVTIVAVTGLVTDLLAMVRCMRAKEQSCVSGVLWHRLLLTVVCGGCGGG